MKSVNPVTGEVIHSFDPHSSKGVEKIINSVDKTWHHWKNTSFFHRSQMMQNLASLLKSQRDELAKIITFEMGKVYREAKAEIEKCALACDYYAVNAESFLQNETIATEASLSYVTFRPMGTILAVMPWNFPFWQVFRFLAPALMAGNTAVLKHASNVPGCAMAIEGLVREAGFPENVFRTLLIGSRQVESVVNHPAIKAVSLTGSVPAGRAVAGLAGKALKKTVMELGGNDPYIILRDADIARSAQICVSGRLLNAGQSCIGAKRFIVVRDVYNTFLEHFVDFMSLATFGDPFEKEMTIGPMASLNLRNTLHEQVKGSISKGAEVLLGGEIPYRKGAYYPPTILVNVAPGMPAYHEELFGPAASVIKVEDEEEAVKIANDSVFGLGAAIFTKNKSRGQNIAEMQLEAGCCFVNDFVKSDPRLPFGGIKQSGYGRELGVYGMREFVNVKTVVIK
ncbi:Succinate-semialdehyde dehydrogenase [NAD]; Succinate-semialdehyde dehydrogenase [NADP+] [hydrothermal vent metagenome]|uniref:Succinate-semialdehyde dehydrogenase [NAD] Succinate-semialdehyde dehydrogenase [NADP+] n=1 Tax=hydrothermal vent metagenome TaxID=652676 RepID=A0A3B0TWG6_9ZZZZ